MANSAGEMTVFVRAVERGSFAAAADDLGLSPSAVSKLITRLEARLGARLLIRTTRRLALTADGEVFLERSRKILGAIEAAPDAREAPRRAQLLAGKQGRSDDEGERSVDIRVTRLRRKIEAQPQQPELIRTVRGEGYMFVPESQ